MRINFFSKLAGFILIIAAIVFIGFKLNWWEFGFNYDSSWTLIIAVPFLIWMLVLGVNFINSLGFYTGLGLLIYNNGYINDENICAFVVVMLLFSIGTTAIGSSYKFIKPTVLEPVTLSRTSPDIRVFAGMKHIRNNFKGIIGGRFRVFSGSLLYDFRKASIDDKSKINVKVRFGKLYLVFPDDIMVESNVKGNFTNGLAAPKNYHQTIQIGGTVKFGKLFIIRSSGDED